MNNKVKVVVDAPNKIKVTIASKKYGNLIFKHAEEYIINEDLFNEFKHVFLPIEFIEEKKEAQNKVIEETENEINTEESLKEVLSDIDEALANFEEEQKEEKKEKKKKGRKKKRDTEDEE